MQNMQDYDATAQIGRGPIAHILTWGGLLLLLVGVWMTCPYVSSRLVAFSPYPTPTSMPRSFLFTPSPPPATATSPSNIVSLIPTPSNHVTPTPTPLPVPSPTPAVPTRILIPVIGVDAPVLPVSQQTIEVDGQAQIGWEVLDKYAAGWHETSAPLGVPGNTVLNGHNTTHGEVFRYLYTLQAGDTITVYSGDVPHVYAVTEKLILPEAGQPLEVRLQNARHILPTEDERLTLVTCHPYGSLRYRLIVIAHPVEPPSTRRPASKLR